MAIAEDRNERIEETPAEARQGAMMRWPVRVLVISTIAGAALLGLFLLTPH